MSTTDTTVMIDGFECLTVEKWKFLQQWNEGNLPATIECWLNDDGYLVDPCTADWDAGDFDDDDTDEDAGWVTDFTPSANLYALIATKSSVKRLHVYDYDLDEQIDTTLVFKNDLKHDNPSPSNEFSFDVAVQMTGTYAGVCYSYYILWDDTAEWLWFRVDHYTGQIDYSFDGTNYTDTTFDLTDEAFATISVQLTDDDKFKLKKDSGSWSAEITNTEGAYSMALQSFQILTSVANKAPVPDIDEDFEAYNVGDSIIGGQWSWVVGPAGTSTFKCAAGKVGQLIANTGRSQVLYTFPTASANTPAAGTSVSVTVVGPQSGASNGIDVFIKQNATGPVYGLVFQTDGKIYDRDSGGTLNDTGATWSGGSTYVVTFEVVDDTHHKVYINTVDKGSFTNWATTNGKVLDGVALDTYNYATAGNYATTVDIDDIDGSWTTTDQIYPVEAWVDDISNEFFVGVTPSNVRGKQVKIYNEDDKLLWKGYIKQYEKQVLEDDTYFTLNCFDEFYKAAKHDISVSNVIHSGAIAAGGATTSNQVTVTPALTIEKALALGGFMTIRQAGNEVNYNSDSGGSENADTSASAVSSTGVTVLSGTHADTAAKDGTFHVVRASTGPKTLSGYLEYTIDRPATVNETPVFAQLHFVSKLYITLGGNLNEGNSVISLKVWNGTTWEHIQNLYTTTGISNTDVGDISLDPNLKLEHVIEDGGNWVIKIRVYFDFVRNTDVKLSVDKISVDIRAKKGYGYMPIEGRIAAADSTTVFDVNAIPLAELASDNDSLTISDSVFKALMNAIADCDFIKEIDDMHAAMPADERGNDGFTAFKRMSQRAGIDFFLDIDGTTENTTLRARNGKTFYDGCGVKDGNEVRSEDRWGRETTRDKRVTVETIDQIGTVIQFPFQNDGDDLLHDTVYKLLADSLDDSAGRTIKTLEFYLSYTGAAMVAGDERLLVIIFGSTSDPDAAGPHVSIFYYNDAGNIKWKIQLTGNAGSSDFETVTADDNNTIGIKIEFDYTNDTIRGYKREVIEDGADRFLGDDWVALGNQDDCTLTGEPARSICFKDYSSAVAVRAENYLNLHLMKIEFEADEFDGGAITPGGDIVVQKKEDSVSSILVIGGKDANGTELKRVIPDPDGMFDPDGSRKTVIQAGIRSEAELVRYCDVLYAAYADDLNAIHMANYIDNYTQFKVGYFYQFTLDSVNYDEMLRRAEAEWDSRSKAIKWTLDFGKGKTFGNERLFNSANKHDAAIKELMLR